MDLRIGAEAAAHEASLRKRKPLHLKVEDPPSSHTLSWAASEHSACREDALSVGEPWLGRQALLELSPARRALALLGGLMGAALSGGAPLRMSQALQSSASII